jgi:uncharacterized membrane protein
MGLPMSETTGPKIVGIPWAFSTKALATASRWQRLDALRALAMLWMAAFHFAFDLNHFGLLSPRQDFYRDLLWTGQRTAIVSLFLFTAGLSLAVALHQGVSWRAFWRRWAQIAACAAAVSLASAWMFPRSWIYFGVLHGLLAMLPLARCAAPLKAHLWWLAGLMLLAPQFFKHALFDAPWLHWTGLVTRLPVTEDYVPVLPWLGVVLLGLAAGQWLLVQRPAWLSAPLPAGPVRALSGLGRWSLSFYMLHQPLLIGGILLYLQIRR